MAFIDEQNFIVTEQFGKAEKRGAKSLGSSTTGF